MATPSEIYSDGVHLISGISVAHLHEYAKSIGIHRCWFHKSRWPHYDLPKKMRNGQFFLRHPEVIEVNGKEIIAILERSGQRIGSRMPSHLIAPSDL